MTKGMAARDKKVGEQEGWQSGDMLTLLTPNLKCRPFNPSSLQFNSVNKLPTFENVIGICGKKKGSRSPKLRKCYKFHTPSPWPSLPATEPVSSLFSKPRWLWSLSFFCLLSQEQWGKRLLSSVSEHYNCHLELTQASKVGIRLEKDSAVAVLQAAALLWTYSLPTEGSMASWDSPNLPRTQAGGKHESNFAL